MEDPRETRPYQRRQSPVRQLASRDGGGGGRRHQPGSSARPPVLKAVIVITFAVLWMAIGYIWCRASPRRMLARSLG